MSISTALTDRACHLVEKTSSCSLPFHIRGITVNRLLISATIEILDNSPLKTLPQNCRNDIRDRTPDGLDRRIKEKLNNDLRTANIISDVLAKAGVVKVVKVINPETGREVKGSRLLDEQYWMKVEEDSLEQNNYCPVQIKTFAKMAPHRKNLRQENNICRADYLNNRYVRELLGWLEARLDEPGSFKHTYYLKKARFHWSCNTLYDAYNRYWWPFNMDCPLQEKQVGGNNGFEASFLYLTKLAESLRSAVSSGDVEVASKCALAALEWGGVLNKNRNRLISMGRDICSNFAYVQEKLNMNKVCLGEHPGIHINSGFTKLYFLLVDNFIMYDGRVGAALGLLTRLFCKDANLEKIPAEIEFSFGRGQESSGGMSGLNRRDPSKDGYSLPEFTGNPIRHLNDNIKASWLLKELADKTESRFALLTQETLLNMRLTAIQAALFMLGYDVRG